MFNEFVSTVFRGINKRLLNGSWNGKRYDGLSPGSAIKRAVLFGKVYLHENRQTA